MGGGNYYYRFCIAFCIRILCIIALLLPSLPHAQAVGILDFAKDTVTSNIPNKLDVNHTINFTLPITSQQITPSDWIIINFPNYFRLTSPGAAEGGFGTPSFVLEGNRAKVTNIALLPGTSLEIRGITAQNPSEDADPKVIIQITDDAQGLTIRNQATIVPTQGSGYVEVSAIFKSPLAAMSINGFTGPGTFVTLTESGTVIGTTSGDSLGYFTFPVTGVDPGVHNFRITGSDTDNRTTSQATLQLNLLGGTVTTASGILLSPTIQLDKSEFQAGSPLTIFGTAKPSSQINIFTESPLRSYSTTTNTVGFWTYTIPGTETANYLPGQYRVYTNIQDDVGNQSIASNTLSFTVLSASNPDNPPPACDISQGDLNCDTKTNLTDFSILLFHWRTDHKLADINSDGNVNLVDFSIMMFYFRR